MKEFNREAWIKELEEIRKNRLLSYADMALELCLSYKTLMSFMDLMDATKTFPKTLRKIKSYIIKHRIK